jgi:hypothetical protein
LGIKKVYIQDRPGLAMDNKSLNRFSCFSNEALQTSVLKQLPEFNKEHSKPVQHNVEQALSRMLGRSTHRSRFISPATALEPPRSPSRYCMPHQCAISGKQGCEVDLDTSASLMIGDLKLAGARDQRIGAFSILNSEDLPASTHRRPRASATMR